jgi:uncharacterized membrane protein YedE/YeeE
MNLPLSPETATSAVLWGALLIGLLLGAAGQASRFCVRGAIADWAVHGARSRMLEWVLVVAVAAAGTQALIALQGFDATRTLPWSDRFAWASYLLGGLVFGYGMVLAAGCPQRSLVKAGSRNLRADDTLIVAALRGPQDLGSLLAAALPLPAATLRGALLLALLVLAAAWLWRRRAELSRVQWTAGLLIGLLVPAAFWLTGQVGYLPEHPETLEPAWLGTQSRRPEALTFTGPIAHAVDLLTYWSDRNMTASFGVLLAAGVLLGSHLSARWRGEFRLESFGSREELRDHLLGGLLMGVGGVTAAGCSVGQGVTGLAMLSGGAVLAVAGIAAGALLALRASAAGQRERQRGLLRSAER